MLKAQVLPSPIIVALPKPVCPIYITETLSHAMLLQKRNGPIMAVSFKTVFLNLWESTAW